MLTDVELVIAFAGGNVFTDNRVSQGAKHTQISSDLAIGHDGASKASATKRAPVSTRAYAKHLRESRPRASIACQKGMRLGNLHRLKVVHAALGQGVQTPAAHCHTRSCANLATLPLPSKSCLRPAFGIREWKVNAKHVGT